MLISSCGKAYYNRAATEGYKKTPRREELERVLSYRDCYVAQNQLLLLKKTKKPKKNAQVGVGACMGRYN